MRMSDHKYQTLPDPTRRVRPASCPTGFEHDFQIPVWEENDGVEIRCDRLESEEVGLDKLVNYCYAGVGESNVGRAVIIPESLIYVG